ncbi:hypothetical protein LTR15_005155 [Elasticomyces elasticus]|nr:hypothetical protein LTR15_005155 [Elasticomyces elasticus]
MATFASLANITTFLLATTPFAFGVPIVYLAICAFALLWYNIFPTHRWPASRKQLTVQATLCLRLLSTATTIVHAIAFYRCQLAIDLPILWVPWIMYRLHDLRTYTTVLQLLSTDEGRADPVLLLSGGRIYDTLALIWHGVAVGNDVCNLHGAFRGWSLLDLATGGKLRLSRWEEAALWVLYRPMFDTVRAEAPDSLHWLRAAIWMRQWLWDV